MVSVSSEKIYTDTRRLSETEVQQEIKFSKLEGFRAYAQEIKKNATYVGSLEKVIELVGGKNTYVLCDVDSTAMITAIQFPLKFPSRDSISLVRKLLFGKYERSLKDLKDSVGQLAFVTNRAGKSIDRITRWTGVVTRRLKDIVKDQDVGMFYGMDRQNPGHVLLKLPERVLLPTGLAITFQAALDSLRSPFHRVQFHQEGIGIKLRSFRNEERMEALMQSITKFAQRFEGNERVNIVLVADRSSLPKSVIGKTRIFGNYDEAYFLANIYFMLPEEIRRKVDLKLIKLTPHKSSYIDITSNGNLEA